MLLTRALKHRPFALIWSGQTVSRIGDFLYEVTLAWWVLQKTGSATAMALVLIFALTPMVLFLLLGGTASDRLPRVPLMLASDLGRGLVVTVIALLAWTSALEVWQIYVASLIFGFVDAFFQPAYMALVPEVTPVDDLPSANALTSISVQAGRVIGPPLGAGIIAASSTTAAFAINAVSFFVSALLLLPLLRVSRWPTTAEDQPTSVLQDVREGIGTVLSTPWLWITIAVVALTNVTLTGPYQIAIPFLVKDHYQADVRMLGLLYAMFPLGYIAGGLWMGRYTRFRRRGWIWYSSEIAAGLGMLALGLPIPIVGAFVFAILNGAALEIGGVVWTTALQELVPNKQLGRVSSIDMLGSFALLPIGLGITGWATNAWGPATVCLVGGALTVVACGVGLLHPAVRRLD
jgi:MFS family permease